MVLRCVGGRCGRGLLLPFFLWLVLYYLLFLMIASGRAERAMGNNRLASDNGLFLVGGSEASQFVVEAEMSSRSQCVT